MKHEISPRCRVSRNVKQSTCFPTLANAAWPIKIYLLDGHTTNTTQNRHFPIFMNFDKSSLTFRRRWNKSKNRWMLLNKISYLVYVFSRHFGKAVDYIIVDFMLISKRNTGVQREHCVLRKKWHFAGKMEYWASITMIVHVLEPLNVFEYNIYIVFIFSHHFDWKQDSIYSWYDAFYPNVIPGAKWNTVHWGKMTFRLGKTKHLDTWYTLMKACASHPLGIFWWLFSALRVRNAQF